MSILGEVLDYGTRVRTPAYTDELRKGDAVDSGIVMILDSNLSWLARESLHQLGTAIGSDDSLDQTPFDEFEDIDSPANTSSNVEELGWTRRDSYCWGPVDLTIDRVTSDGNEPRKIIFYVDCTAAGAGTLILYGAVTQGPGTPRTENLLGIVTVEADTVRERSRVEVLPQRLSVSRRRARPEGDEYAGFSDVWLWLGWKSTSGGDRIIAVDVWETR